MSVMTMSMAATHARGKKAKDNIFVMNARAQEDAKLNGKENVLNGTLGSIMDEYVAYAPIAGLPEFMEAAKSECFGESRPDAFLSAVATAGGTGGVHHLVHNYTNPEDIVLTADWYWGAYEQICGDNHRHLETYPLFDAELKFNFEGFKAKVLEVAAKQENVVTIFNTPGNNPTGFSLTDEDWDKVIAFTKELVANGKNKFIIACDVAYIDYSGEKQTVRRFFKKFSQLPKEIFVVVCYSLSKGFTLYGQRVGAMIGITSDADVDAEFKEINALTSRATWSNICRPAMRTMANIVSDPAKLAAHETERAEYCELIQERAKEIVEELTKEHVYVIPLKHGVRIAACSIPKKQMHGLAKTVYNVMHRLGHL